MLIFASKSASCQGKCICSFQGDHRVRKDKGERGTIETEMKAENRKNTCMVIPMQVPEELITGSQKAFLLLRIESDPFV